MQRLKIAAVSMTMAGIVLVAASHSAHAQDVNAAVDKAVQTYDKLKTARGTFEQSIRNPLTATTLQSRGSFQQDFPNKFSFRFSSPPNEAIVSDGTSIWLYQPSTSPGRVGKCPIESLPFTTPNILGEFVTAPRTKYNISEGKADTVGGRAVRGVVLVPKEKGRWFRRASVWIDEQTGLIRQFETEENSGFVRRVRFVTLETGTAVDERLFTFTAPRGVKVDQSCG